MKKGVVILDVREDLQNGREPFRRIMQALDSLQENQDLCLIAPFEPAPLYQVLVARGFSYEAKQIASDHWEVLFTTSKAPVTLEVPVKTGKFTKEVQVDLHGSEPQQLLAAILDAVAALPKGAQLRIRTDRRPVGLFEQLIERGFSGQTEEVRDGGVVILIRPLL